MFKNSCYMYSLFVKALSLTTRCNFGCKNKSISRLNLYKSNLCISCVLIAVADEYYFYSIRKNINCRRISFVPFRMNTCILHYTPFVSFLLLYLLLCFPPSIHRKSTLHRTECSHHLSGSSPSKKVNGKCINL